MAVSVTGMPGAPGIVGPGIPFRVSSTLGGGVPAGAEWDIGFSTTTSLNEVLWHFRTPVNVLINDQYVLGEGSERLYQSAALRTDGQTTVRTFLVQSSTILDQGQQNLTWDAETGVSRLIQDIGQTGGGFTSADRTTLNNTLTAASQADTQSDQMLVNWQQYEQVTLPSLQTVLNNIITGVTATIGESGNQIAQTIGQLFSWLPVDHLSSHVIAGPSCLPLDVDLSNTSIYAVAVNVTTVDPSVVFRTPDAAWSARDMAVLTITRGQETIARYGVHTTWMEVSPLPGVLYPPALIVTSIPFVPPQYNLHVDWLAGCCGEIWARATP